MLLLIVFAFAAGIVTILSPCILPILPIVLSGAVGGGKQKPLGIVTGFIGSFTFFTLFLSAIVKATGISADILRTIAVVIIFLFGVSLLLPKFQIWMEMLFSRLARFVPKTTEQSGFGGGVLIGFSLGLVWAPCVGPILASVIALAATSTVTTSAILITLAYATGTTIPLLTIVYGGRTLLTRVPWLLTQSGNIQKIFGVLMIATAIAILTNLDRKFQTYILDTFPQYGVGLTKFEDNPAIKKELEKLQNTKKEAPSMLNTLFEPTLTNAPDFIPGGSWINSDPLTMKELKGKVVLVDFWTYTCINCIRTLPYLKAWHEKYKDKGLVIVGVHTPEFEFEKNLENVKKAVKDFGLLYPIMQDNDYATWTAYANHYWPAKYFVDKNGKIRGSHFGEGNYEESERTIQELLKETGSSVTEPVADIAAYNNGARTPETYLGFLRMAGFASPEKIQERKLATYTMPKNQPIRSVAFGGQWLVTEEYAQPSKDARLTLHFEAKEVYLVMRPKVKGTVGRVVVMLDNEAHIPEETLGDDARNDIKEYPGSDVTISAVTVSQDRLYRLIKLPTTETHTLKLLFEDANIELYAFTFG